jgi:hypothetical protein
MGKFILSEEERKRIKLLYEQNQGFDANDFNKQFADKTSEGAIKNTFGEELYKKTSDLAKKFGMTLIERDYQHHMWSKDLKYGNKLFLLIANTNDSDPARAYVATYGDLDGGKDVKVEYGTMKNTTPQGGRGTYPDFQNIVRVLGNGFDRIEPEMNRISKAL